MEQYLYELIRWTYQTGGLVRSLSFGVSVAVVRTLACGEKMCNCFLYMAVLAHSSGVESKRKKVTV